MAPPGFMRSLFFGNAASPGPNTRHEIRKQQDKIDEAWIKEGMVIKNETRKQRFYDGGAYGLYNKTRKNPDWKPKKKEDKKDDDKKKLYPYQNWPDALQHMGFYNYGAPVRAPRPRPQPRPRHHRYPPPPPYYAPYGYGYPPPAYYYPPPRPRQPRPSHYYPNAPPYNTTFTFTRKVTGRPSKVKGMVMTPPYFPEEYRRHAEARYPVPLPGTFNARPMRPKPEKKEKK